MTAAFVSGLAGTAKASEVLAFFLEAAASRMEAAIQVGHVWGRSMSAGLCLWYATATATGQN